MESIYRKSWVNLHKLIEIVMMIDLERENLFHNWISMHQDLFHQRLMDKDYFIKSLIENHRGFLFILVFRYLIGQITTRTREKYSMKKNETIVKLFKLGEHIAKGKRNIRLLLMPWNINVLN